MEMIPVVAKGDQKGVREKEKKDIDNFCWEYGFYKQENVVDIILRKPEALLNRKQEQNHLCVERSLGVNPHSSSLSSPREASNDRLNGRMKSSATQIAKRACEMFIRSGSASGEGVDNSNDDDALADLSEVEKQDVKLVQLFLEATQLVCGGEFEKAGIVLNDCQKLASDTGTPVQRAVFYYREALGEKIKNETATTCEKIISTSSSSSINEDNNPSTDLTKWRYQQANLTWYQQLHYIQVIDFAAVQAMLESIPAKSKVHFIDLRIRSGVHWALMMQTLAKKMKDNNDNDHIHHMKITAIESTNKEYAEATGRNLQQFAKSLNLKLTFSVVFESRSFSESFVEEYFCKEAEEAVIVYAPFVLRTMTAMPERIETLMKVIRRLQPVRMVVTEVEANLNSPSFTKRFTEGFFFHMAFFDSLEEIMSRNDPSRRAWETGPLRDEIHCMVALGGHGKVSRSVTLEVWRAFFVRFGIIEAKLEKSVLDRAHFVLRLFSCCDFCTLEAKENCLVIGWKGTSLFSVSVWKLPDPCEDAKIRK